LANGTIGAQVAMPMPESKKKPRVAVLAFSALTTDVT
jgi:hypothetical protein